MKRALVATLVLFTLAFVGIGLVFFIYTRNVEAKLAAYKESADKSKLTLIEFIVEPPADTPSGQPLYITGSAATMGNWDAAGIQMQKQPDGKYKATLEVLSGIEYGYKITRGTWSTVEKGPADEELPNRVLKIEKAAPVEIKVANWVDHGKAVPGQQRLTGIIRTHPKMPAKDLHNERTLIVYLPPDYDSNKDKRYPVLYMQDGGNLFNESTSYAGIEWGLDEAAEKLIKDGKIEPLIIVGIYSSEQRTPEFTPPSLGSEAAPSRGDAYAKFVVEEVMPFINERYRTKTTRQDTGIGGGSMGGLIALYTAKSYPSVFGKVALLSPWLQLNGHKLTDDWSKENSWLAGMKIHLEMGDQGGKEYPTDTEIADAKALAAIFDVAGLKHGTNYTYEELLGQAHNEATWAKRCEPVLLDLYKK